MIACPDWEAHADIDGSLQILVTKEAGVTITLPLLFLSGCGG
ncbi:hypothetical protein CHCC20335_2058 [Bacillus paralicheniformis]|nr:hypothetical protein CHCC20335_2058 [Bacillus paralicheniformis]